MLLIILLAAAITFGFLYRLNQDYILLLFCRRIKALDGSPVEKIAPNACGSTIFGNSFDVIRLSPENIFQYTRNFAAKLKRSYTMYIILTPIYNIIDAEAAELVLNDANLITKAYLYRFLEPFLGTGLLTSTAKKWHTRRKLLTPAFHFNILAQFEEIFKLESEKFVRNINENLIKNGKSVISLSELIPRLTLNTVCETALGVKLDQMLEGDKYRENIQKIEECFVKRVINPLLMSDALYYTFGGGWKDAQFIKNLHVFSSDIIDKRRKLFEDSADYESDTDCTYGKQRYAMLDTLLHAERDGLIDHAGICEEVDTFMFEGFDTTSMNLVFACMNLALHPEMQQRCYEEMQQFIDDDLSTLDIIALNKLKYLECFIKETLRLYPSVPMIIRKCLKDTALMNGLLLPKGTVISVHIFDLHRNPLYYDEPEEFRPERFLPENCEGRHPFAFIPFSAGQRNCIGQKFAMLEVKTVLVYVLKHFRLLPITDPKSFRFQSGFLIRSQSDIQIEVVKRVNH